MKKTIIISTFTLLSSMFIGCSTTTATTPPIAAVENECCPGYKSVEQANKCIKVEENKKCLIDEIKEVFIAPVVTTTPVVVPVVVPEVEIKHDGPILKENKSILISVVGQGVAPMNTSSPAQAYALAKRAATADSYRLIAEKVKGVYVEGQDLVQNMMVKRSTVRTSVNAMVKNANVVETTFKEGLCEVEMEVSITHSQFSQ